MGDRPDRDSDGTPDDCDECPDDPNKTEPGACGCGTPDTDTDGDGLGDACDSEDDEDVEEEGDDSEPEAPDVPGCGAPCGTLPLTLMLLGYLKLSRARTRRKRG